MVCNELIYWASSRSCVLFEALRARFLEKEGTPRRNAMRHHGGTPHTVTARQRQKQRQRQSKEKQNREADIAPGCGRVPLRTCIASTRLSTLRVPSELAPKRDNEAQGAARSRNIAINAIAQDIGHEICTRQAGRAKSSSHLMRTCSCRERARTSTR